MFEMDVAAALQASDDHTGERCATGAPAPLKAAEFAERTGEDRANAVPGTLSKFFLAGQRFVERLQGPVSGGS